MSPKSWQLLLAIQTLLLLLLLQKALCHVNPNYSACKPFQCGSLNISYPFFVAGEQPQFCGSDGFNVSCNHEKQTIINLSNDDYVINSISYQDLSINITNSAFSGSGFSCLSSVHNLTLGPQNKFSFANEQKKELILLEYCSTNLSSIENYSAIKCKEGTIFAVHMEDFKQEEVGKCNETIVVQYDAGEYGIGELLMRKGITVDFSANNCSVCESSGGRCGFHNNTSDFYCFCPDRDHKGSCHASKKRHLAIILGTVIPGGLAIILAVIAYCHWRHRKNKSQSSPLPARSISFNHVKLDLEVGTTNGVTVFSYTELDEATNNFDPTKQLGEGGFGVVYYGKLRDGREVAVKRLYERSYKRIEQFKNEIRILTDLRHQNLVTLYGCTCCDTQELVLVYEYIPNGTVADHLHGEKAESKLLPWSTRLSISIEIATALSYLHFQDIVHRDVKSSNILLDNSFAVKVADFGLSRLFPADVTHVSTAPQGTPGYVDPEYYQCYHLTDKSDVYSFGVLLIEMISSLPAVDVGRERHEINLSNYAINRMHSSALSELVDPKLGFQRDFKITRMITLVAELAYRCLQHERETRPSMEEVKDTLIKIATEDYEATEAEESEMSASTTDIKNPPAPPMENDVPPSPDSVIDKWLNSSRSS